MNWTDVAIDAVIGMVGALIGQGLSALYTKFSGKPKSEIQRGIVFILIILTVSVAGPLGLNDLLRHFFVPNSALSDRLKKKFEPVIQNEKFQKEVAGKSTAEIDAYARSIGHLGIKRLPDEDLVEWNRMRLELSELDPDFCQSLWTGNYHGNFMSLMSRLPAPDQEKFSEITAKASLLELENKNPFEIDQKFLLAELSAIGEKLPPAESVRYNEALIGGTSAKPEEACLAMKTIMKSIPEMSAEKRAAFLRSVAAI